MTSSHDLTQFHRIFFEEAAEHLATMEMLLVSADERALGTEEVNAVFRAAHSIKGEAGTFGFADLADLTHEAETLLDKVRSDELALSSAMIDALLAAVDVLKAQLAHHASDGTSASPDPSAVSARLHELARGDGTPSPAFAPARATGPVMRTVEIRVAVPPGRRTMPPSVDTALAALAESGVLEALPSDEGARMVSLLTDLSDEEIRERFAFAVEPSLVTVHTLCAAASTVARNTQDDYGFGFFADAPGAPLAPVARLAPVAAESADGFGFFPDAPGAPTRAVAPPPAPLRTAPRESERAPGAGEQGSIRVGVEKIDQLVNQVGELVITQAMLAQAVAGLDPMLYQRIVNSVANLERNTRSLQESVLAIRMLPIAFVFNRFPRTVRDLAAKLGKQVRLELEGEGTELDKGLIERIADPLTHLMRNAIDHGIEAPEVRRAAGKPETGTIVLRAGHRGGNIVIQIADDGRGLDRAKILAKARERGLAVDDAASDQEVWQLIFEAGFSTADAVTDVSGRGVGMDVVRGNIHSLGGSIELDSAAGLGTRITVRLPLTLAITDGMSVAVGSELYILPLSAVVESLQGGPTTLRSVAGRGRVADVRGEFLPVLALRELFGGGEAAAARGHGVLVVVEAEGARAALLVDELVGQHQVVVKSLEANYRKVSGVSGGGARRERLEAKVFGGGNVVPNLAKSNVGHRNAEFVLRFLATEGVRVAASDLADVHPRKVCYYPVRGRVLVKRLRILHNDTIARREADYRARLAGTGVGGAVELF